MKLNIKIEHGKSSVILAVKMEEIKMLCQFSFQNFKSYRDETVFDLQALQFRNSKII